MRGDVDKACTCLSFDAAPSGGKEYGCLCQVPATSLGSRAPGSPRRRNTLDERLAVNFDVIIKNQNKKIILSNCW